MRGQQIVNRSPMRSNSYNPLCTGPHAVPSYRIFRSAQVHQRQLSTTIAAAALPLSPPRIFGVSDAHTDYLENFKWAESLDTQAYRNDILLLAGDVCDELTLLEDTLTLLKTRFGAVFFCVGNHDLWIRSSDTSKNSLEKLQRILALCDKLQVHTTPRKIDNSVWIAPLHSWHHKSFDTDPDIPDIPAASTLTIADYAACTWPPDHLPPGSLRHGSVELAEWFDRLNDGAVWEEILKTRAECDVISFSHFLPYLSLMPEKRYLFYPNLVKASGSLPLATRLEALKPDVHLFGHTHFAWDAEIQGTRYIQAPLGAPLERHRRLRTICFNAFMTEESNNNNGGGVGGVGGGGSAGSTWSTACDPTEAKWLPIELYQFNNQNLCLTKDIETAGDRAAGAEVAVNFSQQHRGPTESLRDEFTTANEATHGILPDTTDAAQASTCDDDDDPISLCEEEEKGKDGAKNSGGGIKEKKRLKHGTMPGPLGAHWSDYYATHPRTPEITTLAPWVAHLYQKRRQRRQKENQSTQPPQAAAATNSNTIVD